MEASAPYGTSASPPADLRELVAPVAAWLAQTGFQAIECGPAGAASATLDAHWAGAGHAFRLLVQATPTEARCHLWSRAQGLCFSWMRVQSLPQVQLLLTQNAHFRQAHAALLTP